MNKIKYIITIITFLHVVVFSSCGHKHTEGDGHNHGAEETTHSDDDGHNLAGEEHQEEGLPVKSTSTNHRFRIWNIVFY